MIVPASFDREGFDRDSDTAPVQVTEPGPSAAARIVFDATHATVYPALSVGCHALGFPWPFGFLDHAAHMVPAPLGLSRASVELPHAHAELIRARAVARRTGRVVLYCHGGGFLCCGINTHLRLISRLSRFADAPILAVNYRMLPHHSVQDAVDDCRDAYRWLRARGYRADQIVVAGDSAGGYLALTLAQHLAAEDETPAGLTLMSPLLQLDSQRPRGHGAMLPHSVFKALTELISGHDGTLYEPLDHIESGLPPTLIHVSGAEELVYDARLAAERLAAAGVPVQLGIWPGQIHVFQIAAPVVPEATRSLRQIGAYIRRAVSLAQEREAGPEDVGLTGWGAGS